MVVGGIATISLIENGEDIGQGLYSHKILSTGLAWFAFIVSCVQVALFGIAGERVGINLRLRGFRGILNREISLIINVIVLVQLMPDKSLILIMFNLLLKPKLQLYSNQIVYLYQNLHLQFISI